MNTSNNTNIEDYLFCNFITSDNIQFECTNCGIQIHSDTIQIEPPKFICSKPLKRVEGQEVSFVQKLKNFAKATAEHVANGLPMCSEDEIIRRHNICLGCEFFKDDTCSKCGCPLVRTKQFASKLSWADQECPVGKWGKIQKN